MALRIAVLLFAFSGCGIDATSVVSASQSASQATIKAMEQVFLRSETTHKTSMETIMNAMSAESAWQLLEKRNLTSPALIQMTSEMHGKQSNLRKAAPTPAPTGYAAVEGARKMLNEMIYTSMSKYDDEIADCSHTYAELCAAMQEARGQISGSNYEAAESRAKILQAQSTISQMETDIPAKKQELVKHNRNCRDEKTNSEARLDILQGDIKVLSEILKMTECKSFMQMDKLSLRHCQDPCTKKSFISFEDEELQKEVSNLQSSLSHGLMQDTFKDLFEGMASLNSIALLETSAQQTPLVNKTKFNKEPHPKTIVPNNPCTDPNAGRPAAKDKLSGRSKCSISNSPVCPKIQERFLGIQSGIKDEETILKTEIQALEVSCKEVEDTMDAQISADTKMEKEAEKDLADGEKNEARAEQVARDTNGLHKELDDKLKARMPTCSKNYINFESELCALKRIRGELYKKLKGGYTAFFQDCVVSKWNPAECKKNEKVVSCGGGEQKLSRNVLTLPDKGAKCLPLSAEKKCNMDPCGVDCKLDSWNGWSKCSAVCGGGVQQRIRDVLVADKYGGKPCDSTSNTRACNNQACEKDCVLQDRWGRWGKCSKDCDGGTQKRQKFVKEAALGEGKCPGRWSSDRLQYTPCNLHRCHLAVGAKTLTCNQKLDVVVLLDGSGSLGRAGWNAELKAAQTFVDAFSGSGAQAKMAVTLYSGPRTWAKVRRCWGNHFNGKVDLDKDCNIKNVDHFTSDMGKVKADIGKLKWPQGSTLTSLALLNAATELGLGRSDAKSIVVAITDGRPLSSWATYTAARIVRKKARLVWVAVTEHAPLWMIKTWATRRWQENVVEVKSFKDLEKPDLVTHVIANICPAGDASIGGGSSVAAR